MAVVILAPYENDLFKLFRFFFLLFLPGEVQPEVNIYTPCSPYIQNVCAVKVLFFKRRNKKNRKMERENIVKVNITWSVCTRKLDVFKGEISFSFIHLNLLLSGIECGKPNAKADRKENV